MPFTVSHALYALPLRYIRTGFLSTTGLVLGSMSPDMEYFVRLEPYRSIGHTWQGLWLQALPLSMMIGLLFHFIVKIPLAAQLPAGGQLNSRFLALFQREQLVTWQAWPGFIISVILGFITHILLDQFTHAHSDFMPYLPWIWSTELLGLPLYKLLQYGLSLLGLLGLAAVLGYSLLRIKPEALQHRVLQRSPQQKLLFWLIVMMTALGTTAAKLLLATSGNTIGILVVAPITGTLFGITIASLFVQIQRLYLKN